MGQAFLAQAQPFPLFDNPLGQDPTGRTPGCVAEKLDYAWQVGHVGRIPVVFPVGDGAAMHSKAADELYLAQIQVESFFLGDHLESSIPGDMTSKPASWPLKRTWNLSPQPCPCGYYGSQAKRCRCTPNQIERYLSKVSGPLMDRMDIHIDVPAVSFAKLRAKTRDGTQSDVIRAEVLKTRAVQIKRFSGDGLGLNATMSHRQVEQCCQLDEAGEMMLKNAMAEFGLSAQAHDKICKVARTVADLAGSESIMSRHLAEAISYRKLDRSL